MILCCQQRREEQEKHPLQGHVCLCSQGRIEVSATPAASLHTHLIVSGASMERKQAHREITYGAKGFLIGEGNSTSVSIVFFLFQLHDPFAILLSLISCLKPQFLGLLSGAAIKHSWAAFSSSTDLRRACETFWLMAGFSRRMWLPCLPRKLSRDYIKTILTLLLP